MLTREQIIFIIAVSVVLIGILFIIVFIPARKNAIRKRFDNHYYRKIYSIVQNNDYLLVNKFAFRTADAKIYKVDHIVGGEKFIYFIFDYYYEAGSLCGNISDRDLIFIDKKGKKQYADNPLARADETIKKFIQTTTIDPTYLIGVVIVNDECAVSINGVSQSFYIVQRKRLASLIKAIEARDVGFINQDQLVDLMNTTIVKMNKNKRAK